MSIFPVSIKDGGCFRLIDEVCIFCGPFFMEGQRTVMWLQDTCAS